MGFGVVGARGEVSYGDAGLVDTEAGAGAEPVPFLGKGGGGEEEKGEEGEEKDGNAAADSKQEFLRKRLG